MLTRLTELQYRLLLRLSRDPAAGDYAGGTLKVSANPDSALGFLRKTLPDFDRMIETRECLTTAAATDGRHTP